MKYTVTIYGLDIEVSYDDTTTHTYTASDGTVYTEAAVTDCGRLIAIDETTGQWVQLASDATSTT